MRLLLVLLLAALVITLAAIHTNPDPKYDIHGQTQYFSAKQWYNAQCLPNAASGCVLAR